MFENLPLLPPDPLLGVMDSYLLDSNPQKVDLGLGVYKDELGDTPILNSVKRAEARVYEHESTKMYAGSAGEAKFGQLTLELLLGDNHPAIVDDRICISQTPGGCGALRVASDIILRCNNNAHVWVSSPTWDNHVPLLGNNGLQVSHYPYYDPSTNTLDFDAMADAMQNLGKGDLLLLHGCCHNPSGADLSFEQWQIVAQLANHHGFIPFIDIAYQGLGQGLEKDARGLRHLAEVCPRVFIASSFSKNFAIYRERAGAISIITSNASEKQAVSTQLASVIRGIYSTPPTHGAQIVQTILEDDELKSSWRQEVRAMRERIRALRSELAVRLKTANCPRDFSYIKDQNGLFSFLGFDENKVAVLRDKFSIYMPASSRINIPGFNQSNMDYLVNAIVSVAGE